MIATGKITNSGVRFEVNGSSGYKEDRPFSLTVVRQGNDYRESLKSSAVKAYIKINDNSLKSVPKTRSIGKNANK